MTLAIHTSCRDSSDPYLVQKHAALWVYVDEGAKHCASLDHCASAEQFAGVDRCASQLS